MTDQVYNSLMNCLKESVKRTELRMLEEKPDFKNFSSRYQQVKREEFEKCVKAADIQIN